MSLDLCTCVQRSEGTKRLEIKPVMLKLSVQHGLTLILLCVPFNSLWLFSIIPRVPY